MPIAPPVSSGRSMGLAKLGEPCFAPSCAMMEHGLEDGNAVEVTTSQRSRKSMLRVRLLGIADRIMPSTVADGIHQPITIVNLRRALLSTIFPVNLSHCVLLFSVEELDNGDAGNSGDVIIKVSCGTSVLRAEMSLEGPAGTIRMPSTSLFSLPLMSDVGGFIAWEPSELRVEVDSGDGKFNSCVPLVHVPYAPMSDETRRALLSKPQSAKAVRLQIICSRCHEGITPVVALNRGTGALEETATSHGSQIWYEDLPDMFECRCGTLKVPLKYIRSGMPSLLGQMNNILPDGSVVEPAMTRTGAYGVVDDFRRLLATEPPEEEVQQFIQNHLLMLSPFAAAKIFFKPAILTKYKADFGILTSRNELLLIEIERPNLQLFKADGGQAAPLTHAVDQIREWEQIITEHRAAALGMIDCDAPSVARVRYLVIAGRDLRDCEEFTNRLLRSSVHPEFMTFDHLIASVEAVIKSTY
jgi:Domain of unknown function (DUF4263)